MTCRKKSIRNGGNPICGSQSCSERRKRRDLRRNLPPSSSPPPPYSAPSYSAPPIVTPPDTSLDTPHILATHVHDDRTLPVVPGEDLKVYQASRDAAQLLAQELLKPDLLRQLYHVYTIEIDNIKEEYPILEISEEEKDRVIKDILDNDHMYGYDRKYVLYGITQAEIRKSGITFDVLKRYIDRQSRFT